MALCNGARAARAIVDKAPNTLRQLRGASAGADAFACLPFANNLEDEFDRGPVARRLFFFAEMPRARAVDFGAYSEPKPKATLACAALQQHVIQKRRQQAALADALPPGPARARRRPRRAAGEIRFRRSRRARLRACRIAAFSAATRCLREAEGRELHRERRSCYRASRQTFAAEAP